MGTRISKFINERPKSMVDIGGMFLLDHTINLLKKRCITDICVCVGYDACYIKDNLVNNDVTFVYNPFFNVTNGIASIWFAKEFIDINEDLLIMSGDLFIEDDILDIALGSSFNPVLLVDSTRIIEADYRFNYENNILKKHGKDLSIEETNGENLGLAVLRGAFVEIYKQHMEEMINNQISSVWWESVLYDLIPTTNIYVEDVCGKFWAEVDQYEDYRRILIHKKTYEKN